jgi:ABC-2 type transport system ATP-binding protein
MDKIITISHISKYFYKSRFLFLTKAKKIVACEDINLEIEKGCSLAILGPNASGKTTLIKLLCGLLLPNQGSLQIQGYALEKQPAEIKKNIGLVLDCERSFYFRLTGLENLLFFARLFGLKIKKAREKIFFLAKLLKIENYLNAKFMIYSTGIRQRFAIARSLVHDPDILLMDEPTRSLDINSASFVRNFISDNLIKKQNKTLIFTTHNINEAIFLAKKIAILKKGLLVNLFSHKPFEQAVILKTLTEKEKNKNA